MALTLILVGLIGIIAGGIVNVLADDVPPRRDEDGAFGDYGRPQRPHYPDGTPRPRIAWLGLTAFLFGKRTSPGGSKLSWRHPIVEIVTAILMVITASITTSTGAPKAEGLQLVFWLVYMPIMVLITVIDLEHKLILFVVIIPSAAIALIDALLTPVNNPPSLLDALIGGVAGFIIFFILYNGGFLFTYLMSKLQGREINEIAFGYGDVMMSMLSGLILGWQAWIFATFITIFLGALGALLYLITRGIARKYSMYTALPYGPYIVIGTLIMLLFSETVTRILGWN